jgi:PKD repeat protein
MKTPLFKFTIKAVTLIIAVCFSGAVFAQFPQITSANQIPSIGDTIIYTNANTFGFNADGSGGATDVIWNFSALSATNNTDFWYVDPSTTPEAGNFTSSNIAMANSVQSGYEYFETTANTIMRWGYASSSSIYYKVAWNRFEFPIDPGTNWSTTYAGNMSPLGVGEDSVTIESGNYLAVPDQYGTLSLPPLVFGGDPEVFDSVIRVHVTESFAIKAYILGTPAVVINVTDDYYYYFDEESQEPIVVYGSTDDDQGSPTTTVLRYQAIPGTGTVAGSAPVASFTSADIGGGVVNFTDGSTNAPASWLWNFDDGNLSTQQNPSHLYAVVGQSYSVCLTATNGSGSNMTCNSVPVFTSIQDHTIHNDIAVFPNPSTGSFTIESKLLDKNAVVTITDLIGKCVYVKTFDAALSSSELNVSQISPGIYTVKIVNAENEVALRLVVQ